MSTYIAFLRAINLGRNRKVPMAELRGWLAEAGYDGVETHIQTGNVRLETSARSRSLKEVETDLERLLAERAGFEVPTIVFTCAELVRAHSDAEKLTDALGLTASRRYLTLLKDEPNADAAAVIDAWDAPGEGARALGRAVFWWLEHPTAQAKLSNARLEKGGAVGTTRDLKVIAKLVDKWCTDR